MICGWLSRNLTKLVVPRSFCSEFKSEYKESTSSSTKNTGYVTVMCVFAHARPVVLSSITSVSPQTARFRHKLNRMTSTLHIVQPKSCQHVRGKNDVMFDIIAWRTSSCIFIECSQFFHSTSPSSRPFHLQKFVKRKSKIYALHNSYAAIYTLFQQRKAFAPQNVCSPCFAK